MTGPAVEAGAASTVVLVEGERDAAVVRVLADRIGIVPGAVALLVTGGATGAARSLGALPVRPARILALVDANEAGHVRRALEAVGAESALLVCEADLEDELIRATGTAGAEEVLAATGDLRAFRVLQRQPQHRGRPVDRQLHRFIAAGSGRKARIDAALAARLDLGALPPPLAALLDDFVRPLGERSPAPQ